MATSGPMLVTKFGVELRTSQNSACSCGRFSSLFYRLWLGWSVDPSDEPDAVLCSWCAGERLQLVPHLIKPLKNGTFIAPGEPEFRECGKKLVLLPDPKATLTDDERADVQVLPTDPKAFNLKVWALQFGTPALQHRICHGLEWEKLAEFQWAKMMAEDRLRSETLRECDQFQFIDRKDMRTVQVKARRTPTDSEVTLLDEARAKWLRVEPLLSADLDLVWVKPEGAAARTELQVTIDLPTGNTRRLFYTLPPFEETR